jgi:hypothetical protein
VAIHPPVCRPNGAANSLAVVFENVVSAEIMPFVSLQDIRMQIPQSSECWSKER